jgi:hypothetical protein
VVVWLRLQFKQVLNKVVDKRKILALAQATVR